MADRNNSDAAPLKRNTKRVSPAITHCTHLDSPVGPLLLAGADDVLMLINFPTGSQALQPRPEWVRDAALIFEAIFYYQVSPLNGVSDASFNEVSGHTGPIRPMRSFLCQLLQMANRDH